MKEKSKYRFFLFSLFCLLSFFIVSCSGAAGGGGDDSGNSAKSGKTYTVNYQSANYGTIPDSIKKGISVKADTILNASQLPALTDDNAVFNGWYDGETKAVAGSYKVTKNVTLVASWTDKATISYSSVFGSVPTSLEVNLNHELTAEELTSVSFSPYTFLGWFYSQDENGNGTGIQAQTGDTVRTDISLTAKWQTATISFETQFGGNSSVTKYTGQKISAAEIRQLSQEGYTFDGWYDGSTKLEVGEEGYAVTEDKTFTAKWTPKQFYVVFYKYHNDVNGLTHDQLFTFGTPQNLSLNTFTRSGYDFMGWSLYPASTSTDYLDGQSFSVPAHTTNLYPVWKPKDYKITFEPNGGAESSYEQTVTFKQASKLTANTFTYKGYRFSGWNTAADGSGNAYADEADFALSQADNITLYAQWIEADRYIISYQDTMGADNTNPSSYRASEGATLSDLTLQGYVFKGWYNTRSSIGNDGKVESWGPDEKSGDIILYARWSPRTDTPYKIQHIVEQADGEQWELIETEELTGKTGSTIHPDYHRYPHYKVYSSENDYIWPDGSTVVKIYYKREKVSMTFDLAGGKIGDKTELSINGKYGQSYTIETPQKTGWTFKEWTPALPEKMEAGSFTATYTANTDTPYKVYHYQQNANDNGYTLKDTDNKNGTTEGQTEAAAKTYTHFTPESFEQKTIAADGSTEITIKYKRDIVTLTLDLAGGTLGEENGIVEKTGKWGQTVITGVPEREGYVFAGWNTSGGELPSTFDSNATYTALWTAVKGFTITVNVADISVTKSTSGGTITFTAEDCDSYSWMLDNEEIGTNQSCAINTSSLTNGTYTLALEAQKGSRWYSYYAQIKVGE